VLRSCASETGVRQRLEVLAAGLPLHAVELVQRGDPQVGVAQRRIGAAVADQRRVVGLAQPVGQRDHGVERVDAAAVTAAATAVRPAVQQVESVGGGQHHAQHGGAGQRQHADPVAAGG
jgi:hypothetical protein